MRVNSVTNRFKPRQIAYTNDLRPQDKMQSRDFKYASYPIVFGYASALKQEYLDAGDIPCPCCGKTMISNKVLNSLNSAFKDDNNDLTQNYTKTIVDFVKPYEESLHEDEEYIFEWLKDINQEHPKKSLQESIILIQADAEENMDYQTLDFFKAIAKKIGKKGCSEQILAKEITKRIISPSVVTIEHIKPDSDDGESDNSNYLFECHDCNQKRGATPFAEWVESNPEMSDNIQKYINKIIKLINDGKIKDYNYPKKISKTLNEESEGKILPNTSKLMDITAV